MIDNKETKNNFKETLERELDELFVIKTLEKLLGEQEISPTVFPIRPRIQTNAGEVVRELREKK